MYNPEDATLNQRSQLLQHIKEKGTIAEHYDLLGFFGKTDGLSEKKYKWLMYFASIKETIEYLESIGVKKLNN